MRDDTFKILIVDDEDSIRTRCIQLLKRKSYCVKGASNGEQALSLLKKDNFSLVIADIRMPGLNGIELLERIKEMNSETEVVMITGYGTIEDAVRAMKLGAYDYITKPFDMERLLRIVEHVETKFSLRKEVDVLKKELKKFSAYPDFIGFSEKIQQIFEFVKKISPTDCNVLIEGETGTGKGLLARMIHMSSPRSHHPFIVVDCAALTETLLESELFGYVKGAFTGAYANKEGYFKVADKGTVFLDEISELSMALQGKLLRVTQEREIVPVGGTKPVKIDTRIIAATNKRLDQLVKEGKFREDLFFRINVVRIEIPPLRERKEDIVPLVRFFMEKFKRRYQKEDLQIDEDVFVTLQHYDWPGNVRELENVVQQMVITADGKRITVKDIPGKIKTPGRVQELPEETDLFKIGYTKAKKLYLDSFTRRFLVEALRYYRGNITQTAKGIKIQRPSLQRMMKRYNILKEEFM